jgi:hypothetical protein
MIYVIIIGLATVALTIYLVRNTKQETPSEPEVEPNPNLECCGAHEICEAETLLTLKEEIIYYSDEELDIYKGINSDAYNKEQIEEFRDVLLTLQMHEVTGWLKSLQLRQIEIPTAIREEALMIVDEFRQIRMVNRANKA